MQINFLQGACGISIPHDILHSEGSAAASTGSDPSAENETMHQNQVNMMNPVTERAAVLSADWVVPVGRPVIRRGAVWVHEDTILWVGPQHELPSDASGARRLPLPPGYAILPGLVNCHAHLDLSYLGATGEPGRTFPEWMRDLVESRRDPPSPDLVVETARKAAARAAETGTVAVADVGNTGLTAAVIPEYFKHAISFLEVFGHDPDEAAAIYKAAVDRRASLQLEPDQKASIVIVPHTPYTTSRRLFEIIAEREGVGTVHIAEVEDEDEYLINAGGSLRRLMEKLGTWSDDRTVPGLGGMDLLERTGYLKPGLLLAHGIHLDDEALARAASAAAVPVACPVSNLHTGAGFPPVRKWIEAGLAPCFGTDSVASGTGMNLFADMLALLNAEESPDPSTILEMGTMNGATALGLQQVLGSLEPGKEALVLSVPVETSEAGSISLVPETGSRDAPSNRNYEDLCRRIIRSGAAGRITRPWR